MFGIGGTELFLILIFGFLIIGPERLPQMGRTIGRAIRQFKSAQDEVNKVIQKEVVDPFKQVDSEMRRDPFAGAFSDSKGDNYSPQPSVPAYNSPTASATAEEDEESFAERKARMAREKEEARARKAAKKAAAAQKKKDAADSAAAASAPEAAPIIPPTTPSTFRPEPSVKKVETTVIPQKSSPTTAASLYNLPAKPAKKASSFDPHNGLTRPAAPAPAPADAAAPVEGGEE